MDDKKEMNPSMPEEQAEGEKYVPRPTWQVWGARIGLVIFLLFVALQLLQIAGGGL